MPQPQSQFEAFVNGAGRDLYSPNWCGRELLRLTRLADDPKLLQNGQAPFLSLSEAEIDAFPTLGRGNRAEPHEHPAVMGNGQLTTQYGRALGRPAMTLITPDPFYFTILRSPDYKREHPEDAKQDIYELDWHRDHDNGDSVANLGDPIQWPTTVPKDDKDRYQALEDLNRLRKVYHASRLLVVSGIPSILAQAMGRKHMRPVDFNKDALIYDRPSDF